MAVSYDLVGDIGGTNVRFALAERGSTRLRHRWSEPCRSHDSLVAAARTYLAAVPIRPERACLALAGPIVAGTVRLTNSGWTAHEGDFATGLGLTEVRFVNDFAALALALPELGEADTVPVGPRRRSTDGTLAVVGPGTGLGVAGLHRSDRGAIPLASEGGHIGFAAETDEEARLVGQLRAELGHVSVERLVSGPGLVRLYGLLAGGSGARSPVEPAGIVARADTDPHAARALELFTVWLCRFAGDAALAFAARGGVFIGGGIAPRIVEAFGRPAARAAFETKGRMTDFLRDVPLAVITAPDVGLRGAAAWIAAR